MIDILDLFHRYCLAARIDPSTTSVSQMCDRINSEFSELCVSGSSDFSLYGLSSQDVAFCVSPTDAQYAAYQSFISTD